MAQPENTMSMVQVRFTKTGSNSALGGFSAGDTARVSAAFAKHLVEDAQVADYLAPPKPAPAPAPAKKPAAKGKD